MRITHAAACYWLYLGEIFLEPSEHAPGGHNEAGAGSNSHSHWSRYSSAHTVPLGTVPATFDPQKRYSSMSHSSLSKPSLHTSRQTVFGSRQISDLERKQ
ncbi:unnamed protein product [Chondrus crispus]|uniref:Uncharacterized protein n=1 Tax=Chondrus crispus TaxID=2769 RepID=R7Q784_CHOCR|nr:unnamed protein product [Chondrus crispus]CDF34392.1 unnamed protein product [Chondrus crispus]|eukprot:XP_005714211.1 unnamed protein product [Chondrus crispus]